MAFAASLPAADRVQNFSTKIFLKNYALHYLPKSIVHRRKRGLSVPIGKWLRGPLRDWAGQKLGGRETSGRLLAIGTGGATDAILPTREATAAKTYTTASRFSDSRGTGRGPRRRSRPGRPRWRRSARGGPRGIGSEGGGRQGDHGALGQAEPGGQLGVGDAAGIAGQGRRRASNRLSCSDPAAWCSSRSRSRACDSTVSAHRRANRASGVRRCDGSRPYRPSASAASIERIRRSPPRFRGRDRSRADCTGNGCKRPAGTSETAPGAVDPGQEIGLDQPGEELLGQVARGLRIVAAAADERIERVPVRLAKFGQRPAGLRIIAIAVTGGEDPRPPRRRERRRTDRPGIVGG